MANLQVKNFPDELHERLRQRAKAEHRTVSDLVTEALTIQLSRPSMTEWRAMLHATTPPREHDIDLAPIMAAVKDEIEGR